MKKGIEHLSDDNLMAWFLFNLWKTDSPISETLEINKKIYLHFDKDTLYEEKYFIKAGEYALFEHGKGIIPSDVFNKIGISNEEMEHYIESSSDFKIYNSKVASFVYSISLYELSKPTSKERLAENKREMNEIVNEYKQSKPYMQHVLSEKVEPSNVTNEVFIERLIKKTLEKLDSITEQDLEKNLIEEKAEKAKTQAIFEKPLMEEINKEIKDLKNSCDKISTVIEYKDCYKPEDMLKEIINAKNLLSDFKRKNDFASWSRFRDNEKLQEQGTKLETIIDKAVESFNKKVDEYNDKNEEKLPHLSSKEDIEKYNLENFIKDDDAEDFNDDAE